MHLYPAAFCKCREIGATERRSACLMPHCQCAYILFHLDETEEEGVKDLVSIKKSTTKSGRRAIEMSMRDWRRKREWTRENGRPPKVKEWSGRRTNSREGVCALEGASKEEKQWWESTLVQERERGRLRSDRVAEQKEDRKWGWRAGKKVEMEGKRATDDGWKCWSAPHRPADTAAVQHPLIYVSL